MMGLSLAFLLLLIIYLLEEGLLRAGVILSNFPACTDRSAAARTSSSPMLLLEDETESELSLSLMWLRSSTVEECFANILEQYCMRVLWDQLLPKVALYAALRMFNPNGIESLVLLTYSLLSSS